MWTLICHICCLLELLWIILGRCCTRSKIQNDGKTLGTVRDKALQQESRQNRLCQTKKTPSREFQNVVHYHICWQIVDHTWIGGNHLLCNQNEIRRW